MRLLILSLCVLLPFTGWSHSPNEIQYQVQQTNDQWTMTVHFTPVSAIYILESQGWVSRDQQEIQLDQYASEFTNYFQDHVALQLNDQSAQIQWSAANFNSHDAWIQFTIPGAPQQLDHYEVSITAFHEIFRRPVNILILQTANLSASCQLTVTDSVCSSNPSQQVGAIGGKSTSWYLGFLSLVMIGIITIRIAFKFKEDDGVNAYLIS